MTRYDGLEFGGKVREFSSKKEAQKWKDSSKNNRGKIGRLKGKLKYTIRKTR